MKKNILFLTGTRADFGKIKPLLSSLEVDGNYNIHIFVTGMHMLKRYGYTCIEVERLGIGEIYKFINQNSDDSMDIICAKTILGLSDYLKEHSIDILVVHGDRVEALAGATAATLNNILVVHIEGGEVSGTVDEIIRHAASKLSHIHFVANDEAKKRLIQLGENKDFIKVIGSPDIDVMMSDGLPAISEVKNYYDFQYDKFSILLYHPVTTEIENAHENVKNIVDAVIESKDNYIVIYPNNDLGTNEILNEYKRFYDLDSVKVFPSMRFEYFLTLLKNCEYIIGNSSAGIRECPIYGKPSVNIGTRQHNRAQADCIINCDSYEKSKILDSINCAKNLKDAKAQNLFGDGNSSELFVKALKEILEDDKLTVQKHFIDNH